MTALDQRQQGRKAGLSGSAFRRRAAEMVDHDRRLRLRDFLGQAFDDRQPRIDLHMPAERCHPVDRGKQVAPRRVRIGLTGGFQIDPDAAYPGPVHLVERLAVRRLVDHGDPAGAVAEPAHAVQGAGIVAGVDARLHDDDARQVQAALQLQQLIGVGRRRRVAALCCERKFAGRAEDVHVAVAGPERDGKSRGGSGLGRC